MDKYRKITFNYPEEEYIYLKMACARKGVKMKDFLTEAIVQAVEEYEDELDLEALEASKKEIEETGTVTWEEMEKNLGWDKL